MAGQKTYVLAGKEFNVWTQEQLCSINREALKKRCLDLREHVGQDRLPPMPRQPDGMVAWMLEVQKMAMGAGRPASYQAQEEYDAPILDSPPHGAAYGRYDQEPASRAYDQAPPSHDLFNQGHPGDAAYGAHAQQTPSHGHDQAPPSIRGYAPSDAGSVAESRVGALGSKSFIFEDKEYNVWTERQLSAMNRNSLMKRCMDFRDSIGRDRLRPMPRQPEEMVMWLLNAQTMVMQGGGDGAARYEEEYARCPPGGMARDPRDGQPQGVARGGGPANNNQRDYEPSEAPSECQSNYEAVMREAQAIREKNQGSRGIF